MEFQSNPKRVTIRTAREDTPFIILYDVTFDGGKGGRGKVLFVNKKHIVWAEPEEQPG
jgi:hypothetical protein